MLVRLVSSAYKGNIFIVLTLLSTTLSVVLTLTTSYFAYIALFAILAVCHAILSFILFKSQERWEVTYGKAKV